MQCKCVVKTVYSILFSLVLTMQICWTYERHGGWGSFGNRSPQASHLDVWVQITVYSVCVSTVKLCWVARHSLLFSFSQRRLNLNWYIQIYSPNIKQTRFMMGKKNKVKILQTCKGRSGKIVFFLYLNMYYKEYIENFVSLTILHFLACLHKSQRTLPYRWGCSTNDVF